jgi:hypothetical protein
MREIIVKYWGVQYMTHHGKIVSTGLSLITRPATFSQVNGLSASKMAWDSSCLK